jgi:hypothetical protein
VTNPARRGSTGSWHDVFSVCEEPAYRWRLMDLYLNDSRADKCLAELKFLADQSPKDIATRNWYAAYKKAYDSVL